MCDLELFSKVQSIMFVYAHDVYYFLTENWSWIYVAMYIRRINQDFLSALIKQSTYLQQTHTLLLVVVVNLPYVAIYILSN